jgi:hypothetical protein
VLGQDEVGAQHPAAGLQQALEDHGGEGERRVGDDPVGTQRQPQVAGIGLHHDDVAAEARTQLFGSTGVHLDGDDPSARR